MADFVARLCDVVSVDEGVSSWELVGVGTAVSKDVEVDVLVDDLVMICDSVCV